MIAELAFCAAICVGLLMQIGRPRGIRSYL